MINPFLPSGPTVVLPAATPACAGVQVPGSPDGQYRVYNAGTETVFLGYSKESAANAVANAVAPVAGVPSKGIPISPSSIEVLSFTKDAYFSGLSVGATVYITPGKGL